MTIALSGAVTDTLTAPMIVVSWASLNDLTTADIVDHPPTGDELLVLLSFMGRPSLATYSETTAGATCLIRFVEFANPTNSWLADTGTVGSQGTCSITFTALTPTASSSSSKQYCAHGSLRAVLPDASGSTTDAVTLTSSF